MQPMPVAFKNLLPLAATAKQALEGFLFQPKIHPDLAIATLRQHKDRLYRLWTLARALNEPHGSGVVPLADIQACREGTLAAGAVAERGYKGFSPGTLRRLLHEGEGVFWQMFNRGSERILRLHGLAQVCEALGVHKLKRAPVYLEPRHLKTMLAFRAACYASQFTSETFGNPISRKTLGRITGRSTGAQLRYERAMVGRIDKRRNAAMGRSWKNGDEVPEECFVALVAGETVTLRRLPNSYKAEFNVAPRGSIRNVNRYLSGGKPNRISGLGARSRERLFYDDDRAAQRRAQALSECDQFYLHDVTRRWKCKTRPTAMWSQWMVVDRGLFCS